MRVGFLIYGGLDSLSGGYLYDRELVSYLQRQGDTVEVISLPRRVYWQQLGDNLVPGRLGKTEVDILIQDELVHPSVVLMNRRLKHQRGYPIVGLVHLLTAFAHQPAYRAWFYRLIEARYLGSVDGLILNSRNTLNQARVLMKDKLPSHTIAVPAGDHLCSDDDFTREPAPEDGPLKILYVGNIIRQKGLDVLLRCLHMLPPGEFRLTVTGRLDMEPAYAGKIDRLLTSLRLQDRVTVTGPVREGELIRLYRTHHILVLPSVNEAYGIVYVEAQKFGLPVIGTTAGGAAETISHGVNGYLIHPGDYTMLAEILSRLHRDRNHLRRLGRNALDAFRRHPTWDDTGKNIRRFLIALVDSGTTR